MRSTASFTLATWLDRDAKPLFAVSTSCHDSLDPEELMCISAKFRNFHLPKKRDSSIPLAKLAKSCSSPSTARTDSKVAWIEASLSSSAVDPQNPPRPKIWAPGAEPCQPGCLIPTPGSVEMVNPSSLTVIGPEISHFPLS